MNKYVFVVCKGLLFLLLGFPGQSQPLWFLYSYTDAAMSNNLFLGFLVCTCWFLVTLQLSSFLEQDFFQIKPNISREVEHAVSCFWERLWFLQTLFVTFQLLLIFGTDRQQGSTNPALSKQSPDILDVVFVHPPSSRTYHDFLVKEKQLRAGCLNWNAGW